MRINEDHIEVFISSNTPQNPYTVGSKEYLPGSGLYCETVINKQDKLLVTNALKSDLWKNNPDIKLNMISYLGFPIKSPDGTPFGTICVLDDKENEYTMDLVKLFEKIRDLVESQLEHVGKTRLLQRLAETDPLTGLLNRRAIQHRTEIEIERSVRYGHKMSVILFDIDYFKIINDRFGHQAGDEILVELSKQVMSMIRKIDLFGRFGGDEFIIVMPETSIEFAQIIGERIRAQLKEVSIPNRDLNFPALSVSMGIYELVSGDTFSTMINRVDKALYHAKETGRNKISLEYG